MRAVDEEVFAVLIHDGTEWGRVVEVDREVGFPRDRADSIAALLTKRGVKVSVHPLGEFQGEFREWEH